MKSESEVQSEIRLYLSERGVKNFRVNVGRVKTADGRYFDTGLPPGHSDIYGVLPGGRVIYVEAKKEDWIPAKSGKLFQHEEQQRKFIEAMRKQGAVAGFAKCVEDVERLIIREVL